VLTSYRKSVYAEGSSKIACYDGQSDSNQNANSIIRLNTQANFSCPQFEIENPPTAIGSDSNGKYACLLFALCSSKSRPTSESPRFFKLESSGLVNKFVTNRLTRQRDQ
jgi:hypothetical protein